MSGGITNACWLAELEHHNAIGLRMGESVNVGDVENLREAYKEQEKSLTDFSPSQTVDKVLREHSFQQHSFFGNFADYSLFYLGFGF